MTKTNQQLPLREIRKDGKCYMSWTDPALDYSKKTLRSMKQAGYRFYIDGKLQH